MTSLLDQLEQLQEGEYVDLDAVARNVAYGQETELDAATVHQAIKNQGGDLDEFRKQVQLYRDRQKLRDEIAQAETNHRRSDELRAQVEEANAKLDQAVQLHRQETAPLQAELEQLRHNAATQGQHRGELLRTCPSFELKSRASQLRREQEQLVAENSRLSDIRPGKLSDARHARQRGEHNHPDIAAAEQFEARWEAMKERRETLETEIAEIEQQMIDY